MTTEHISFERLSDLADGALPADDVAEIERHLAACSPCASTLGRLRGVLARAAALPSRLDPPADAWPSIQRRLGASPVHAGRRTRWWTMDSWVTRAAAAILLAVGSSTLTVVALRSRDGGGASGAGAARPPTGTATPAAVRAVDDSYAGVVEELTTTLRAQRGSLAPTTIATLERTLRIIDEAIAEARTALAADPGNAALLDVLSANYEQKIQLLRRASELPART